MRLNTGVVMLITVLLSVSGCGGGRSYVPPILPSQPPPGTAGFSISAISPGSVSAGSSDLTLTITGKQLDLRHDGSHQTSTVAVWTENGVDTSLNNTTVDSSTQLTAVIPAGLLANAATAEISVQKWYFADDTPFLVSNALEFKITAASVQSGFISAGNMLAARSGHSATALADGRVLIAGGDGSGATAEIYDPSSGAFSSTGGMNHPREGHSATLLADGRVLIAGGDDYVNVVATAEIYDPATGSFTPIVDMTTARWAHTATLLPGGKVLIAGGADQNDSKASAEVFDPATNSFTVIENMTSARLHHTATLLPNGKVILAGGWSSYDPITPLASSELFDPSTNTFAGIAAMTSDRAMHTATLLPDGSIAMLAGTNSQFVSISSDDMYVPASGIFTSNGALQKDRFMHTATLLPNGKILAAGGERRFYDDDGLPDIIVLASAELFDPSAGTSTLTAPLATARVGHASTLLKSGKVLITGGSGNDGNALASAEIFQ